MDVSCGRLMNPTLSAGSVTLYVDIHLTATGLRQVIGCLQTHPVIRVRPSRLLQPYRHFGRYARLAVENAGQRVSCDTLNMGCLGNAQVQRIETGVLDGMAWMGFLSALVKLLYQW